MEKDSALYQLMGVRMNGIMNDITNSDEEYQEIARKSSRYLARCSASAMPSREPAQELLCPINHATPCVGKGEIAVF